MTTFLLVAGTALVWAALGGAALSMWQGHRFRRAGETFPCRVRLLLAGSSARSRTLPRRGRRARAMWVHDVLLVQRGRFLRQTTALPVRLPEDSIRAAEPGEGNGLRDPLVIELRLDDAVLVTVAAAGRDRTLLAGPFLAAAVASLGPRR